MHAAAPGESAGYQHVVNSGAPMADAGYPWTGGHRAAKAAKGVQELVNGLLLTWTGGEKVEVEVASGVYRWSVG